MTPPAGDDLTLKILREREKATRDILEVISRSRDDEKPVFEAILQSALRLCDVDMSALAMLNEEETHLVLTASAGAEFVKLKPGVDRWPFDGAHTVCRAVRERRNVATEDLRDDELYRQGDPTRVALVEKEGMRSQLVIPLLNGERAIGSFVLQRRKKRPFTQDETSLLQSFAAQAVIAIENVRQFRAIQTSNSALQTQLEREIATNNILEVISRSRDDEHRVFDVIFESLMRLCNTPQASLFLVSAGKDLLEFAAARGPGRDALDLYRRENPIPLSDEYSVFVRAFNNREPVHVNDAQTESEWRPGDDELRDAVTSAKIRSTLIVPLISGQECLGVLAAYRTEIKPFTEDEVVLHRTFAAQAVIAIENVRQFRELQTRFEREAATSEILAAISQYRDDEIPVFEAILENAARLCKAPHAFLQLRNAADDHLEIAAQNFATSSFLDRLRSNPIPIHNNQGSISVRGMNAATPTQYEDIRLLRGTELYTPQLGYAMDTEGMRTALFVPLITEGKGIGVIILYKHEVEPFTADEINLVQTFAAQAVIAIENVKQFKALEALNAELGDRVKEQVGEIERMGRLKRFMPAAVADAVISAGDDSMLSSHRALLGILFCDIRGFTAFCETAEPEETIEVLQTYHEEMGKLIAAHGAGVDHRMGDGIMVLFNDPLPCEDPAGDAVRLALAMRGRMAELCKVWKRLGHRLGFGVGISLGYATVGMVGSEGRYEYTASGTAVNLAARLCDEAEDGDILLSPRAYAAVEDDFEAESAGELRLKGIQAPVEVFRVVSN